MIITVLPGAWIITGGTNAGVMKHVGEAVRDYGLVSASTNPIIVIGVATWGCIQNKEDLTDSEVTPQPNIKYISYKIDVKLIDSIEYHWAKKFKLDWTILPMKQRSLHCWFRVVYLESTMASSFQQCRGKWPASYRLGKKQRPKESFLDPNHTHFVLVDNGTQHHFGVEIPFRARMENSIANMKTNTGKSKIHRQINGFVILPGY